ncbi:MAG TPA: tetratricopeptide repeat protein [Ignavibacteriaceae bacterium]|nr:tetratricopeptide repeat protein [Ignavibacteriaceae bacterium]
MRYSKLAVVAVVFLGFTFMGYQCGSTELTSAKLYIQQKNYDKALELLQKEVQKNPKSDEGYYLLGVIYAEQEKYESMTDAFNKSLAASKTYEENITGLIQSHWAKEFNQAVKSFNAAQSSSDEDSTKIHYDRAANDFQNAILIAPDSTDSYLNLAFVHIQTGNYDSAEKTLEQFLQRGKSPEAYLYLGRILYDKGVNQKATDSIAAKESLDKSINILEEGRKLYPGDSDILGALQNSYIGADRVIEAMDVFKLAAETYPDSAQHQYNYGVLLLSNKRFEEAEQQFNKAIELKPDYSDAHYNLGVTYVEWGNFLNEQAEDKGEMGAVYKEKYNQALPHLEKVVELQPDNIGGWDALYKVYARLNMMKEAEDAYEKMNQLRGN